MNMTITEYDEFKSKIGEIKDACDFLPDVTTDEGYAKSKRVALDVGKVLTKLEKVRKEKKAYFIDGGKQVDSEAKEIKAELESFQLPHKDAYKELDNLKKEREANRKAALEQRVEFMRTLAESMAESHSSEIQCAMQQMQDEECMDFYEYTEQALKARNAARNDLGVLFAKASKAEAEAVELERLRKESAEREQKDREARIASEAKASAEAETLAAVEREKAAEQRAIDAENAAKVAAENARLQAIAEQEAAAKRIADEEAARLANNEHVSNIRREAKEALMALGLSEAQSKVVVLAINSGSIPCVSISY